MYGLVINYIRKYDKCICYYCLIIIKFCRNNEFNLKNKKRVKIYVVDFVDFVLYFVFF